jgi:ribonuclease III
MAAPRSDAVAALEGRIGYTFRDGALLHRALRHASADAGKARPKGTYERLEFLGDRVLGLLTAEFLFKRWPDATEHELDSHFRVLVDKNACARIAKRIDLGPALQMGGGETRAGLRANDTVLADVIESLLGAAYLDGGLEAARTIFDLGWAEEMKLPLTSHAVSNVKAALQEWAHKLSKPAPAYRIVSQTGSAHAPTFTVEVQVEGYEPLTARGRSRQDAEKAAATALLQREGVI